MPVWSIYIVKCADGSLYTGATNDVASRLKIHNLGKGARYTKNRLPVALVYQENCADHSQALKREHQIKQMSRTDKLSLIAEQPDK